jgi:heat shock transcription factor
VLVLPAAEGGEARDVVVTLPAEVTVRVCRDEEVLRHGGKVVFGVKAGKEA